MFRVKDLPVAEAQEMFPDAALEELHATWAMDLAAEAQSPHNAQQAPFYRNDQSEKLDRQRKLVRIVEKQWWEYQTTYRVLDPFTGQETQMDEGSLSLLRARVQAMREAGAEPVEGIFLDEFGDVESVKQRTRRYMRTMLGNKVLSVWEGPAKGGFTWKCMTAERDRNKGTWFGIVRYAPAERLRFVGQG